MLSVVACGDLDPVENGLPAIGNTTLGSVKKFECEDCFELIGSQTLICLMTGVWNDSSPTCNRELIMLITVIVIVFILTFLQLLHVHHCLIS